MKRATFIDMGPIRVSLWHVPNEHDVEIVVSAWGRTFSRRFSASELRVLLGDEQKGENDATDRTA